MPITPPNKPQRPREWAERLLRLNKVTEPLALLGCRGYYRDTMGAPGANDRGIYDDAIFVISPNVYASFNANTDPSVSRPNIAMLLNGVWRYKKGKHKINSPSGYMALVQAAPVTVLRDDNEDPGLEPQVDTGWFGINIHRGSVNSTSSLGCQTVYPSQWEGFRELVYGEMKRLNRSTIPYCLIDQVG